MAAWAIVACARSMRSGPSTRLSRSTLLQLGASSEHNLKFELDKQGNPLLLGKGGFGEVYKARWHGTLVAVKALISDEAPKVAAFQHECRILESLHHTHIVHHYDSLVGEEGTVRRHQPFLKGLRPLRVQASLSQAEPSQHLSAKLPCGAMVFNTETFCAKTHCVVPIQPCTITYLRRRGGAAGLQIWD